MKKLYLYPIVFLLLFTTACGASSGLQAASASSEETIPFAAQLAVGTLQLKDTEQAVTPDQANELLPMWQVYQELTSSDTAAQEEIDGLIEQIQETMSPDQMSAITGMKLTQQDVFSLMQAQGIGTGSSQQSSSGSSGQSNTNFAPPDGGMAGGPPDAGMAGGVPPDGGFGGIGGSVSTTSTDQSQAAGAGTSTGRSAGVPNGLVNTFIQYLEQIAST